MRRFDPFSFDPFFSGGFRDRRGRGRSRPQHHEPIERTPRRVPVEPPEPTRRRPEPDDLLADRTAGTAPRVPRREAEEPPVATTEPAHVAPVDAPPVDVDAELEQLKARLAREGKRELEQHKREVVASFLDVVDDLDRALAAANASGEADRALLTGVEMVRSRFLEKLAAQDVQPEGAVGDAFDPAAHEAVATAPANGPDDEGKVVAVVRTGYRMGDTLLRPASVVVGKRS